MALLTLYDPYLSLDQMKYLVNLFLKIIETFLVRTKTFCFIFGDRKIRISDVLNSKPPPLLLLIFSKDLNEHILLLFRHSVTRLGDF